eukprot:scaffold13820_cov46-Attheya_sp.AAC.2
MGSRAVLYSYPLQLYRTWYDVPVQVSTGHAYRIGSWGKLHKGNTSTPPTEIIAAAPGHYFLKIPPAPGHSHLLCPGILK